MSKIILPPGFGRQGSIDDYAPISQQELGTVAAPVMNAIAQGVPPDAETMIQFGVLCRLLVTVKTLGMAGAATEAQRDALAKELEALKAAAPAPAPRLSFDFLKTPVEVNPSAFVGTSGSPDFLDEIISESEAASPGFATKVDEALARRVERPYTDCPVCERVRDESGACSFCDTLPPETKDIL